MLCYSCFAVFSPPVNPLLLSSIIDLSWTLSYLPHNSSYPRPRDDDDDDDDDDDNDDGQCWDVLCRAR